MPEQPVKQPYDHDRDARAITGESAASGIGTSSSTGPLRQGVVQTTDGLAPYRATITIDGSSVPIEEVEYMPHVALREGDTVWVMPLGRDFLIIGKHTANAVIIP